MSSMSGESQSLRVGRIVKCTHVVYDMKTISPYQGHIFVFFFLLKERIHLTVGVIRYVIPLSKDNIYTMV